MYALSDLPLVQYQRYVFSRKGATTGMSANSVATLNLFVQRVLVWQQVTNALLYDVHLEPGQRLNSTLVREEENRRFMTTTLYKGSETIWSMTISASPRPQGEQFPEVLVTFSGNFEDVRGDAVATYSETQPFSVLSCFTIVFTQPTF